MMKFFFSQRVMGIGPTSCAWEAHILPLYYTRLMLISLDSIRQNVRIFKTHLARCAFISYTYSISMKNV